MIDRPPACLAARPCARDRRQPIVVRMEEQVSRHATPYRAPVLDSPWQGDRADGIAPR